MTRWSNPFDRRLRRQAVFNGTLPNGEGRLSSMAPCPAAGCLHRHPVCEPKPATAGSSTACSPNLLAVQLLAIGNDIANDNDHNTHHTNDHNKHHDHDNDHITHYAEGLDEPTEATDLYAQWLDERADQTAFLRPLAGKTLLCNCGSTSCHGLTLINEYNALFHTTALQNLPTPAPAPYNDDSSDESADVTDPKSTETTLSTNVTRQIQHTTEWTALTTAIRSLDGRCFCFFF